MIDKTEKTYCRIVRQVAQRTSKPAKNLTYEDFMAFVDARAVDDYAPATLNLYRAAANYYLKDAGSDQRLKSYSARQYAKRPERILSRTEVAVLLDALNPFYRDIAERIWRGPRQPQSVLAETPAQRGGTVSYRTLWQHFNEVSKDWQRGSAAPYALFVSGVLHALEDGRDWREIGQIAELADSTMKKYVDIAEEL